MPQQKEDILCSGSSRSNRHRPTAIYRGNGARWRYFGHACILLETEECQYST